MKHEKPERGVGQTACVVAKSSEYWRFSARGSAARKGMCGHRNNPKYIVGFPRGDEETTDQPSSGTAIIKK